jgi:hypothetical protein
VKRAKEVEEVELWKNIFFCLGRLKSV